MSNEEKPYKRRRRYELTLTNSASLSRICGMRMHPAAWVLWGIIVLIVLPFGFWYVMLRYTPMQEILPARILPAAAGRYETLARQVDSLQMEAACNDTYIRNIRYLLGDTLLPTPDLESATAPVGFADRADTDPSESLPDAGSKESAFVRRYEAAGRNRRIQENLFGVHWMTFSAPVQGARYTAALTDSVIPCLKVTAKAGVAVHTAYRGTVIDVVRRDNSATIIVQHPDNFITIYRGVSDIAVSPGSRVTIGQQIARTGADVFIFEMWQSGTPLDPTYYLSVPVIGTPPRSVPFEPDRAEAERQRQERRRILEESRRRERSNSGKEHTDSIVI